MKHKQKGILFVISAPAGTGKTTLVSALIAKNPSYTRAVTCTTRPPRPGEKHKRDYYFLSPKEFQRKKERGEFLESASVFGYHYGTSQQEVNRLQRAGKNVFLVIDTQGARELKAKGIAAVFVFLSPPSFATLKKRLEMRRTEAAPMIRERLAWAKKEIKMISYYDYHIVNDDLRTACTALKSIVVAEEHKVHKE